MNLASKTKKLMAAACFAGALYGSEAKASDFHVLPDYRLSGEMGYEFNNHKRINAEDYLAFNSGVYDLFFVGIRFF